MIKPDLRNAPMRREFIAAASMAPLARLVQRVLESAYGELAAA